jgi:carboxypeptidase Q
MTRYTIDRRFHLRRLVTVVVVAAAVAVAPIAGQSEEPVDLQAVYQLKEEGLQRSRVMEIASYLTDVHGPRLTGSPNLRAAADWAVKEMQGWGLADVKLEPWGEFGRGWTNDRFVAHMIAPARSPLIGYPKAWTPGTGGVVTGDVVFAELGTDADLETHRGKLKGKFVLTARARAVAAQFDALARRFTDADLAERARQPVAAAPPSASGAGAQAARGFLERRTAFLVKEGVAATLEPGRGDGGTVFVLGGGSRNAGDPPTVPQIVVAVEHYNRLFRILEKKIPVTLELDVRNTFHDADLTAFNVVADIRGADKADELVMLGAHFDSWHAGTGATDNAAGSAVMMEAMRILRASGVRLRRTVRLALWSGEEQGLLGSRAYVDTHLANRQTMAAKPGHAKFSAYFNVDNGTGAIRGVYLQGNEAVAPVFKAWMAPFTNVGMTTLAIRNTGGTDHQSFDAVGLPGFQFIQDPVEYSSRTHHSSMDAYDRLQPADMMQNAVIVAAFAYHAANREALLPRKPMPRAAQPSRSNGQPRP